MLKLPPRKSEPWFVLWGFFLLGLLCVSINLPYGHAWNTVAMSGLVLLITTWNCQINYNNIYRAPGPSFSACLEPLVHRQNVARLSLFYRYFFGRCSSELAQLVPLYILEVGLLAILIDCMIFLSPFLNVTRIRCQCQQFLSSHSWTLEFATYRMWSFDLWSKLLKSRINRHLLTLGSF